MRLSNMSTRVRLIGIGAVLAIGVAGVGIASASTNTLVGGSVVDVSGSGGVEFAGHCNYALAGVSVNSNDVTYVAEGHTAADWPLASTGLRCAYHLANGSVVAFERALPGSSSAIAGTFKAPVGGVLYVCYHATGLKLDNTSVASEWKC